MNLKVIKHKDYGWTMTGGEKTDENEIRFYWSVYKLNNGEIIVQIIDEYWKNNKFEDKVFHYSYANAELKNGEIIEYNFKQNFKTLFESAPPIKDIKNPKSPSKEEEDCVYDFYCKNIYQNSATKP